MAIQGVNIGGWFIPEDWLTPSLYAGTGAVDLYTLLKTDEGRQRYQDHLDAFITEADFKWLAKQEVELIRVPVGYWTLAADEHYPSTEVKLDWAMKMAEKYNIKVLIDLHAVKESQNGQVHSGRIGTVGWYARKDYQAETIDTLVAIARRYSKSTSLWGIELVNEPKMGRHYFSLLRFYRRAYRELKKVLRPGVYTVFHDAFHPVLFSGALHASKKYPVLFDAHWYVIAPPVSGNLSYRAYRQLQKWLFSVLLWYLQRWQPVIIGEWSSVLPQGIFNRTPTESHPHLLAQNIDAQQNIYDPAFATMYWTYKAEKGGMWNFRSLVEEGILVLK